MPEHAPAFERHGDRDGGLFVEGVVVEYAGARALSGIGFAVPDGACVALMGANGAGKSTAMRAVSRVLSLYRGNMRSGSVLFHGEQLAQADARTVVRAGIAQVPEGRKVFANLSVVDNLQVASRDRRRRASQDRLNDVFELFPALKARTRTQAGWLSGGEQQMLAIGRALMTRPSLLMIDELSLGLAPLAVLAILDRLAVLRAETGISILLVEQNARLALKFSDYAYIVENGAIAHQGASATLAQDPELESRYLGGASTTDVTSRRGEIQ